MNASTTVISDDADSTNNTAATRAFADVIFAATLLSVYLRTITRLLLSFAFCVLGSELGARSQREN